ncbi:MAG: acetyltransferase [Methanolobus sp.]|nr:acetyltransferase [Methanolobus sp.]
MKKLILIGFGGHFKSVFDSLDSTLFDDIKILDQNPDKWGLEYKGYEVCGGIELLKNLKEKEYNYAFICIGDSNVRNYYYNECLKQDIELVNIIDKTSVISNSVKLGVGIFIGKKVIINTDAVVNNNAIINTGTIIEHDCNVGFLSFIGPGVILTGGVKTSDNSYIGAGVIVNPYLTIGRNSVIGSGSVVTRNIDSNKVAYGVPCKEVMSK